VSALERPLPGHLSVLAARDVYLAENGFSAATYDAKGSTVTVLGIDLYRPLSDDARRAIRRHDLHHVLTGYGTDYIGEAEISAWELGCGLTGLGLYVRLIVVSALLLFGWLAPRRVARAYRAARGRCLFAIDDYEELLKLDVTALRARVGIPPDGLASVPRRLHARAPRPSR
jgi:hypothetical protein